MELTNNTPVVVMWEGNLHTNKLLFSENLLQVLGYTNEEIATAKAWNDNIHPDDKNQSEHRFEEFLSGKTSMYTMEMRYKCKDGSYKWILSKGVVISRTEDGKPVKIIGTHTDIDARRAIKISDAQYREIFDYSEAIICTHDMSGNIITINPAVETILGFTTDEMIGVPISSIVAPQYRDDFNAKYLRAINRDNSAEGVLHVLSKTGEKKYLLYHNHLFIEKENGSYIIGFAQDITERINTEESLKTSMDTFSSAFKYSAIGIALVSPLGKWLEVNDAVCDITGYSRDELLKLDFQKITYPDDLEIDLKFVQQMLHRKIDSYSLEKRYIAKNGKIIWVLLTVSLVWHTDNTPKFFISQLVDITRKNQLAEELNVKNIELESIKNSLINKVTQLEEFSHIVAHNLRGPAGNIKMLANTLKEGNLEAIFTTKEAIDLIAEASTSLMESLDTLMSIAQIQLNKKIEYNECSIYAIVQQIITQLQGIIFEKKAKIIYDLGIKNISYPKAYLDNILYNLISNALKYSRSNIAPEITISTRMKGPQIILSVKDNGLGIDLEKYGDKVFKLNQYFHQGYDSKGVGLYLVKTQIESLNGSITVQSKVNEGSEFTITI